MEHIYAFGSICRGEIDLGSDIDLLFCTDGPIAHVNADKYSIYKYERIRNLWEEGNPFAWHLHMESKLLFSSDGSNFISDLGQPSIYRADNVDCAKFKKLFLHSFEELKNCSNSSTFHLSCIFLAIRNFATCHSLSIGHPIFSRKSALLVQPRLEISPHTFTILTRARLLSTRGYGEKISPADVAIATQAIAVVPLWMEMLRSSKKNDRIQ